MIKNTSSLFANFQSDALKVNLRNTNVKPDIPSEQKILLEITSDYYGVNQRVNEFLNEFNHPFSNISTSLELFRGIILGDFSYIDDHSEHQKGVEQIHLIFKEFMDRELNDAAVELLIFSYFEFSKSLTLSKNYSHYQIYILEFLEDLASKMSQYRPSYRKINMSLERSFKDQSLTEEMENGIIHLYRISLQGAYEYWRDGFNIDIWYKQNHKTFFPYKKYDKLVSEMKSTAFQGLIQDLEKAKTFQDYLNLPDFTDIAAGTFNEFNKIDDAIDKISFLIRLLVFPGFEHINDQILFDINHNLKQIHSYEPEKLEYFIKNIFSMIQNISTSKKQILLEDIKTFGKEIFSLKNRYLSELFIDFLIKFPFETPAISGVTTEWQTLVNPNHLVNVRIWLAIIEENPEYSNKLISALLINLVYGGFFISDTDLFQKDVSSLLNSDIVTSYNLIKQLTRIFPVYFSEIGAEGELRDVSTKADQMYNREDLLVHFIRKQVHAESNNTLIEFAKVILEFWYNQQPDEIYKHLPAEIVEQITLDNPVYNMMFPVTQEFFDSNELKVDDLIQIPYADIQEKIKSLTHYEKNITKKLEYMIRLYQLLNLKYSFNFSDLFKYILKKHNNLKETIEKLRKADEDQDFIKAFAYALDVLKYLQTIILNPENSVAEENIYYKRHVAAGIPSMYGTYREAKFEALGLTFRLEEYCKTIIEKGIAELNLDLITQSNLHKIHELLNYLVQGLNLDGIISESLQTYVTMLERSFLSSAFTIDQYINIFQFITDSIRAITVKYYLGIHNDNMKVILPMFLAKNKGMKDSLDIYKEIEKFNRITIEASFGLSYIDQIAGKVLNTLVEIRTSLDKKSRDFLMTFNPGNLVSHISSPMSEFDNQVFLGSKGYFLKRLWEFGIPVPDGFILTTELFRSVAMSKYKNLYLDSERRIFKALKKMEKRIGLNLGDATNPLLLSVRSGSAISLPGMMNTFLNIGLNDKITKTLSQQPNYGWTSWDCYRRLIQTWAMAHGISRDTFDEVINFYKTKYNVESKITFSNSQIEEIAKAYKEVLDSHRIAFPQDVHEQFMEAIYMVLSSWESEKAKSYRNELDIADDWGTAVTIQKMILGNIHEFSGTGVCFTRNPHQYSSDIQLFGDFVLTSQGDDVVSGLVYTQPVSKSEKIDDNGIESMEEILPGIYKQLEGYARTLMSEHNYEHQEIEFTFESPDPKDLYILQTRKMTTIKQEKIPIFKNSKHLSDSFLGLGMGMGGGAFNGRVAFTEKDINRIRKKYSGESIILIRPDTVPDDISLIFQSNAILTSRGGYTSHAAVTANSLGKTCVVNCRALQVNDSHKLAIINNHIIKAGDELSIDGRLGKIYKGRHLIEYVSELTLKRQF